MRKVSIISTLKNNPAIGTDKDLRDKLVQDKDLRDMLVQEFAVRTLRHTMAQGTLSFSNTPPLESVHELLEEEELEAAFAELAYIIAVNATASDPS